MKKYLIASALALVLAAPAAAQLKPWQDYTLSNSVSMVTTVKVGANMIEDYLQGLRETWAASNDVEKRLGHMQDYKIYVSDLPASGDFNVMLVVTFANTSDLGPNRARYDAFMKAWGTKNEAATRKTATTVYPNLREITGDYLLREVTFLPNRK